MRGVLFWEAFHLLMPQVRKGEDQDGYVPDRVTALLNLSRAARRTARPENAKYSYLTNRFSGKGAARQRAQGRTQRQSKSKGHNVRGGGLASGQGEASHRSSRVRLRRRGAALGRCWRQGLIRDYFSTVQRGLRVRTSAVFLVKENFFPV